MKRLSIGIVAHVDAGKTTLSEGLLYTAGSIRKLGRVDKQDTFLDTDSQERARGITIFSKQARMQFGNTELILLDTPGHVDFSAEMERTLQVLDYAILVISGSDGVQGHTLTLWKLLSRYNIPVFLFINKMDQPDTNQEQLMKQLKSQLSESCTNFSEEGSNSFYESLAYCDEQALEMYLDQSSVSLELCRKLISERKLFPCLFGSALKLDGVERLLQAIDTYTSEPEYPNQFAARVFKISRDEAGNRLTHMKITGGVLAAKSICEGSLQTIEGEKLSWQEKVNQIRLYSGDKFESVNQVEAGQICTVTGLSKTKAGERLGTEKQECAPLLEPILSYALILPEGCDAAVILPKLRQLEEEEPALRILWDEKSMEIKAQIMGPVQMEVLQKLIAQRFSIQVKFGAGSVRYKETISGCALGAGHFEPLRHYAEVWLLLEEGEPGSGLQFASDCSEDILDRNWQRLILTHLEEKEHCGVLIGAPITDMKITLKTGRAHNKHTEGGDFRQATYRAVRQGLMGANSVLLEPYFEFVLTVPEFAVGRAMTDLNQMGQNSFSSVEISGRDGENVTLTGVVPMIEIRDYSREVTAYTKGLGLLFCSLKGYFPCHNAEEVIARAAYNPIQDVSDTPHSVFCVHGAGWIVPWNEVPKHMHTGDELHRQYNKTDDTEMNVQPGITEKNRQAESLGLDEINEILNRTAFANRKENRQSTKAGWQKTISVNGALLQVSTRSSYQSKKKEYLLIDGYNVIFAWEELSDLAKVNLDSARGKLLDILSNYQAIRNCELIAVFDAYRVTGHAEEILDYHNIHVVYTAEAETADRYIEKFAHNNSEKYDITVATSDGLEQIIITGEGCKLISSRELEKEIELAARTIMENFNSTNKLEKTMLGQVISQESAKHLDQISSPTVPEEIDYS